MVAGLQAVLCQAPPGSAATVGTSRGAAVIVTARMPILHMHWQRPWKVHDAFQDPSSTPVCHRATIRSQICLQQPFRSAATAPSPPSAPSPAPATAPAARWHKRHLLTAPQPLALAGGPLLCCGGRCHPLHQRLLQRIRQQLAAPEGLGCCCVLGCIHGGPCSVFDTRRPLLLLALAPVLLLLWQGLLLLVAGPLLVLPLLL